MKKGDTFPFRVFGSTVSTRTEPHALAIDDVTLSH